MRECDTDIIVLSQAFFSKTMPKKELDVLSELGKRLLPIWHGVTKEEVPRYSSRVSLNHFWRRDTPSSGVGLPINTRQRHILSPSAPDHRPSDAKTGEARTNAEL